MKYFINHIEILGFFAAVLGTISLLPQVVKIWKSRSTESISLLMYLIICVDSGLWFTYGLILSLPPLITQSAITFSCATIVVIMKLKWK